MAPAPLPAPSPPTLACRATSREEHSIAIGVLSASSTLSLFKLVPFLVVSFSPNLSSKTYYFQARKKEQGGKKKRSSVPGTVISLSLYAAQFLTSSDSRTSPAMPGPQIWKDHWSQSLFRVFSSPMYLRPRLG